MNAAQAPFRPVVEGLFEGAGRAARLIGTRCTSCGTLYFPQAPSCRNPGCHEKAVERAELPQVGTLHSYTIQRYAPPAAFRIDDWAPYAIGLVDLGKGVMVMGMLADVAIDGLAIGMEMRVEARPLFDDAGQPVATYAFVPVTAEAR